MKKLNNKGFAISTLLYGLLSVVFLIVTLLISIMATNRRNTSNLVKKIEEELNRFSETTTEFSYTGDMQEYIVPYGKAGWYKIELWGASSNSPSSAYSVQNGTYTTGIAYLPENSHLYFYIGQQGAAGNARSTDVRMDSATDTNALTQRIMVASGGNAGGYYDSTIGGNSYISGYAGGNSVDDSGINTNKTEAQTTNLYFINGIMFPGINQGNGKAKIELVSSNNMATPPTKKTTKLDNVRYIKDCITTSGSNGGNEHWKEIQAIENNGINIAKGKAVTYFENNTQKTGNFSWVTDGSVTRKAGSLTTSSTTQKCMVIDLGNVYSLDEIAVFHYFNSGNTYQSDEIFVSNDGSTYISLKNWNNSGYIVPEYLEGIRVSARQVENQDEITSGNYYIKSAVSRGLMLTAQDSKNTGGNAANVTLELFKGTKLQKWTIEAIGGGYYKVIETENAHALQPADGGLEFGENVKTIKRILYI